MNSDPDQNPARFAGEKVMKSSLARPGDALPMVRVPVPAGLFVVMANVQARGLVRNLARGQG